MENMHTRKRTDQRITCQDSAALTTQHRVRTDISMRTSMLLCVFAFLVAASSSPHLSMSRSILDLQCIQHLSLICCQRTCDGSAAIHTRHPIVDEGDTVVGAFVVGPDGDDLEGGDGDAQTWLSCSCHVPCTCCISSRHVMCSSVVCVVSYLMFPILTH